MVEASGVSPPITQPFRPWGKPACLSSWAKPVGLMPCAAITACKPRWQLCDGGASWTNSISWVEGYSNVLEPMKQLSAQFHRRFGDLSSSSAGYQQALLHVLLLETSCFRYWGQGTWTDYAQTSLPVVKP